MSNERMTGYRVQAQRVQRRTDRHGMVWTTSHQVPTFYLDAGSLDSAEYVARAVILAGAEPGDEAHFTLYSDRYGGEFRSCSYVAGS